MLCYVMLLFPVSTKDTLINLDSISLSFKIASLLSGLQNYHCTAHLKISYSSVLSLEYKYDVIASIPTLYYIIDYWHQDTRMELVKTEFQFVTLHEAKLFLLPLWIRGSTLTPLFYIFPEYSEHFFHCKPSQS